MKKVSNYLLFISIITFFSVVVVVVQQAYGRLIDTQEKISSEIILKPINPQLDVSVLDDLEKKEEYFESDLVVPETLPTPLSIQDANP